MIKSRQVPFLQSKSQLFLYMLRAAAAYFPVFSLLSISLPPAPVQNHCPIVILNRTGVSSGAIYFLAHALDPNGVRGFLVPDSQTGICTFQYPTPSGNPSSSSCSVLLSNLPSATVSGVIGSAYLIYLPICSSMRGYFSINKPLYLSSSLTLGTGLLTINDPSVTSLTDPNFYTLYQDFEGGLVTDFLKNSASFIYLNLSWVDEFCLPMQLTTKSYPTGTVINIPPTVVPSGMDMTKNPNREQIIQVVSNLLETGGSSWNCLGLPYYTNPYTGATTTPPTYLRILTAKNSVSFGKSGGHFQGALIPQQYFPDTYISNTNSGPQPGVSFAQAVYNYYNTPPTQFYFQVFPAKLQINGIGGGAAVYSMTADSALGYSNLIFQFQNYVPSGTPSFAIPTSFTLNLEALRMEQLLSGSADWPYTNFVLPSPPPNVIIDSTTVEVSKLISALFSIGYLPTSAIPTTSAANPFINNTLGFSSLPYFKVPSGFSGGPWYNLYSFALHPQMIGIGTIPNNPTIGLGYAYDYDDLLNISGLIQGPAIQDCLGNPSLIPNAPTQSQPYIEIALESLAGTPLAQMDISLDSYAYPVSIGPAANGVQVSFTYWNGTMMQTTPASETNNVSLGTVHVDSLHPFTIQFMFGGSTWTYEINLQRQIAVPATTIATYSTIDVYFQQSLQFAVDAADPNNPTFFITFNSSPPPFPG